MRVARPLLRRGRRRQGAPWWTHVAIVVPVIALGAGLAGETLATEPVSLVGAGDIAGCSWDCDEKTAQLLDAIPGTVFALGDNA